MAFKYLANHPDSVQRSNCHHLSVWPDEHTFSHVQIGYVTGGRGIDAHTLSSFTAGLELINLLAGDAKGQQIIAGCLFHATIVHAPCQQVFLLGVHQVGGIEFEEPLPLIHRVADSFDGQIFDPAGDTAVEMHQFVLGVGHPAYGFDGQLHLALSGFTGPHAEAGDNAWADADAAIVAAVLILLIDRHQVHAHGRFAGLVAPIIGVHGSYPIQWFCFAVGRCGGR